jgi:hypothetical protein
MASIVKSILKKRVELIEIKDYKYDENKNLVLDKKGEPIEETLASYHIIEPSADRQDEYISLTNKHAQDIATKSIEIMEVQDRANKFTREEHTDEEIEEFRKQIEEEVSKITQDKIADNKDTIEFILRKELTEDEWKQLAPSVRKDIIYKFEAMCGLDELEKKMEMLMPQGMDPKVLKLMVAMRKP